MAVFQKNKYSLTKLLSFFNVIEVLSRLCYRGCVVIEVLLSRLNLNNCSNYVLMLVVSLFHFIPLLLYNISRPPNFFSKKVRRTRHQIILPLLNNTSRSKFLILFAFPEDKKYKSLCGISGKLPSKVCMD